MAERTGLNIITLAAHLQQIDKDAGAQLNVVKDVAVQAASLTTNIGTMSDVLETVAAANLRAKDTLDGSIDTLKHSAERSKDVAAWVGDLEGVLSTVESTLATVNQANFKIAAIAKQVNILAVNARIEAARAGDAGRGFAVVAEAINALSKETAGAAAEVSGSTRLLQTAISDLRSDAQKTAESAHLVLKGSSHVDKALSQINRDVSAATQGTQELTENAVGVTCAVDQFGPAFAGLITALKGTALGVHNANTRAEEIIDISERAVQVAVELGADNADAAIIELVQDRAAEVSALFERGIAQGDITAPELFDATYTPIKGTRPEQFMAPFTQFTDAVLPAVQETVLTVDPRVIFCVAIDQNGYLPTHNAIFSSPQGDDEVWNAAHSRNRRFFNDRVGLKAGRNTAPFLMQTYRRDMGGGKFVMMKDISAPIIVNGCHWGGLRIGLKIQR
ncbi:methyl-accepting chemotaxis protein [Gymnodinialimonas sp. 57CJ19]|uniref:methyl-accepting chemotaxis protein n=1 Tax=Gymnodinialimonas sp. 57CJ19 TaxID=3138498 RepID=UPI003134535F